MRIKKFSPRKCVVRELAYSAIASGHTDDTGCRTVTIDMRMSDDNTLHSLEMNLDEARRLVENLIYIIG